MPRFKKITTTTLNNERNNFVEHLKIPVRPRTEYKKVSTDQFRADTFPVDTAKNFKVFKSAEHRKVRAGLTFKAAHLLLWLMDEVGEKTDIITINVKRYLAESNDIDYKYTETPGKERVGSLGTYRLAILELRRAGIISPTTYKDTYFINPRHFFNGNRVSMYPNNLEEVLTKREEQERKDSQEAERLFKPKKKNA